jgi:hypothetical protein
LVGHVKKVESTYALLCADQATKWRRLRRSLAGRRRVFLRSLNLSANFAPRIKQESVRGIRVLAAYRQRPIDHDLSRRNRLQPFPPFLPRLACFYGTYLALSPISAINLGPL